MMDTVKQINPNKIPFNTICKALKERLESKFKISREELETKEFSAVVIRMSDTQLTLTLQLKPQKGEDASSSA